MDISKKTKVAVLCGGISSEREISLRSGENCFNALKRLGYKNAELIDVKSYDDLLKLKTEGFEVAFLLTHGKYGEDGAIQGSLEWLRIPYTGSSILGSAISMDKWLTKQIASKYNISVPKSVLLSKENHNTINVDEIWKKLSEKSGKLFLKPRTGGSSISTFLITSIEDLKDKITSVDFTEDDYLIEEAISGKEVTVSLLAVKNKLTVLPVLEMIPANDFYDYKAKYTKGLTEFVLPARLNKDILINLESDALKIFTECGCSSFGRVDFMIDSHETSYLLEINSLPGMTDVSDLPAQADYAGIEYDELVEIVLKSARLHNTAEHIKQNSLQDF